MADYAFRLRRRGYGGRVGFNPRCWFELRPRFQRKTVRPIMAIISTAESAPTYGAKSRNRVIAMQIHNEVFSGSGFSSSIHRPTRPCKAASVGGLPRELRQSAIGTSVASKGRSGACLAVPAHDAVVGVDLPISVKSKLSMPKTEGCPGVCRCVLTEAENLSPF